MRLMNFVLAALIAFSSVAVAKNLVLDGSTTVGPIAKAFAEYYKEKTGTNVQVSESGSGNGAKSLIHSKCDIANMSRFMKDKEFKAAVEAGVKPVAHVVAMDGIAMAVHPSNPVKNLTVTQIRDIYSGKISNWKELGGPNKEIVIISRDTNSGTYETFYKLVMTHKVNGKKIKEKIVKGAEKVGSNGASHQRVSSTQGAIGYIGIGFVDNKVKAITVNGIEANENTITSGTYPIARPLYMFTNGYPKLGTDTYKFVTLHLSKDGQEIVKGLGFIPVTKY